MAFTVKEVTDEPKSAQEIEEQLLREQEERAASEAAAGSEDQDPPSNDQEEEEEEEEELSEEKVVSFLKKKYGQEINSLEDLKPGAREENDIPEDVAAFLKYKKETGRGFEDYIKVNRDFDKEDPNKLLKEYYSQTESGLDDDEIDFLLERFSYDEDVDSESEIKSKQIARKKELAKAKQYFESQKEKYKAPLESGMGLSDEEKEAARAYKELLSKSSSEEQKALERQKWFQDKTNEFFGDKFEGFRFKVGENESLTYTPAEKTKIVESQSNIQNFLGKFLNKEGKIEDVAGYHRALAIAMDPDKFAKHFYEQGVAKAVEDAARKDKNINMSLRTGPEVTKKGGLQVKSVNDDGGSGLKIKVR